MAKARGKLTHREVIADTKRPVINDAFHRFCAARKLSEECVAAGEFYVATIERWRSGVSMSVVTVASLDDDGMLKRAQLSVELSSIMSRCEDIMRRAWRSGLGLQSFRMLIDGLDIDARGEHADAAEMALLGLVEVVCAVREESSEGQKSKGTS